MTPQRLLVLRGAARVGLRRLSGAPSARSQQGPPPNPRDLPAELESQLSPQFCSLYKRHLAGRPDSRFAPVAESRGKPTYASLKPHHSVTFKDVFIPRSTRDTPLYMRIYRPTDFNASVNAVVLYFPGGGFVFNGPASEHGLVSNLCSLSQSIIISVGYRLAPENRFPSAVEDAEDAYQWAGTIEHREDLTGLKADQVQRLPMLVAGASAGGGLAASLALNKPSIKGLLLWVPILTWDFSPTLVGNSWSDYAESPFLSAEKMAWFRDQYLDPPSYNDWRASPLLQALSSQHSLRREHTAMRIVAAECDVLRDQALLFAGEVLDTTQSSSILKVAEGAGHSLVSAAREVHSGWQEVQEAADWIRTAAR